ncbi:MAG: hypothetical protein ABIO70_20025 [Pseudomonadota bacterium]
MALHRTLVLTLSILTLAWALPAEARRHHRKPPPPPPHHRPAPPPHHPYHYVHPVHVVVVGPVPHVVTWEACPGPDLVWVGGHPGPGGHWVSGHCARLGAPPRAGWVYVAGYWNGRAWVSGFWRPTARVGYRWVEARVDEEGAYESGYWEPEAEGPPGTIWRPGYWDGARWVEGGWVLASQYETYGPDGELTFFAVGDGVVEDLALPADETIDELAQDGPEAGASLDAEEPGVEAVRHSEPPE